MDKKQRLTINLPEKMLKEAMAYSKKNKTETLRMGLEELIKRRAYDRIRKYRGKFELDIDLSKTRQSRI